MTFVYPTSALKSSFYRKVADQRRLTQDFPADPLRIPAKTNADSEGNANGIPN